MMKRRLKFNGRRSEAAETTAAVVEEEVEWEMRPGGMLVQKRSENCGAAVVAPPDLRIRVAYGAARFQISANSQSTFGKIS